MLGDRRFPRQFGDSLWQDEMQQWSSGHIVGRLESGKANDIEDLVITDRGDESVEGRRRRIRQVKDDGSPRRRSGIGVRRDINHISIRQRRNDRLCRRSEKQAPVGQDSCQGIGKPDSVRHRHLPRSRSFAIPDVIFISLRRPKKKAREWKTCFILVSISKHVEASRTRCYDLPFPLA